jgi:hypothetical protein
MYPWLEFLVATNLKLKGKKSKERRGETKLLGTYAHREAHGMDLLFLKTNN